MAFTIYQQPGQNIILTRSPAIIVAGDSAVTDSTFRVVIKVYAWEGDQTAMPANPIATLDKGQDDSGRAKFNVSPIIEDLFTPNDPANYAIINTSAGLIYNVQFEIGWTNDGAFTLVTTTNVIKSIEGYSIFPQAINSTQDSGAILRSEKFLTARPTPMYAIKGQPMWFYVFYQGTTIASSNGWNWTDGATELTVNFTAVAPVLPVDSDDFLLKNQSTSSLLDSAGLNTSLPISIYLDKVTPFDTKVINFKDEICDIGSDTITFINRYGCWDWLHVYAIQRTGVEAERITYDRRISSYNSSNEVTYSTHNAAKSVLRSKGKRTYQVNTGWITEAHNELLQDMILSKNWFSFNLDVALYLTDTQKEFKKDTDVDLISYTFNFEVASNLIQDIQ